MIVLIDDERSFRIPLPDEPLVFRNSASALQWLTDNPTPHITQLWLDHDLGGDDTIMPVVNAIERRIIFGIPLTIDEVIIHTANPVGAQQLEDILSNHYPSLPSRNPLIPTVRYQVQMITVSKNRTQTTSEVFRRPKEAIDKVKTLILGFRTSYDTPETITA